MIKIIASLLLIIAVGFSSQAQDDTYNTEERKAQLSTDSMNVDIMVIPANYKLYSSYFDRQMIEANNISFHDLRDTILSSLADEVALAFNDSVPSGVILESKSGYPIDMDFVYESIQYTYEVVPQPKEKESTFGKWKNKVSKKDKKPEPKKGTYMEGGQIVSNPETRPMYTNIKVLNNDFLYLLNKRYHAKTFVFINHYEMAISTSTHQVAIQSDNYPRIIVVHFTIVDVTGTEIHSGVVTRNASSYDNKLDYLIGTSFYQIGREIMINWENSK